jgi:hypothetical protein
MTWQGSTLKKLYHTTSDDDNFYIKIVAFNEYLELSGIEIFFSIWGHYDAQKDNMKFWQHINHVSGHVDLEKLYLSCMTSNKDTLYMKIVDLEELYEFLVLSFSIQDC